MLLLSLSQERGTRGWVEKPTVPWGKHATENVFFDKVLFFFNFLYLLIFFLLCYLLPSSSFFFLPLLLCSSFSLPSHYSSFVLPHHISSSLYYLFFFFLFIIFVFIIGGKASTGGQCLVENLNCHWPFPCRPANANKNHIFASWNRPKQNLILNVFGTPFRHHAQTIARGIFWHCLEAQWVWEVCLERFAAVPKTGSLRMRVPARSAFKPPVCTSARICFLRLMESISFRCVPSQNWVRHLPKTSHSHKYMMSHALLSLVAGFGNLAVTANGLSRVSKEGSKWCSWECACKAVTAKFAAQKTGEN